MPLETFHRLSKEKRELFLDAALKEFAGHGFNEASITRLVQHLGIAKGSVYQYFSDKYELYQYLVQQSYDKLLEILNFVDNREYDVLSVWYVNRTIAEIKFAKEFSEDFLLINRVKQDGKNLFAKNWRADELEKFRRLIGQRHTDYETRSFIAYSTKERFIEENTNSQIDQCFIQLQRIAEAIFN